MPSIKFFNKLGCIKDKELVKSEYEKKAPNKTMYLF